MQYSANPLAWLVFSVAVLGALALDLGVFNRRPHAIGLREAGIWTGAWITLAIAFGVFIHFELGREPALEFAAGYLIEKSLSVDNIFVFVAIFAAFAVPKQLEHRILFWGVLGALFLRALFIGLGAVLLQRFHAVIFVFGAILLFTAYRLLRNRLESPENPQNSLVYRLISRVIPSTHEYKDGRLFVRENGRLLATPMLIVLLVVEASDVIFAVDSIPAVFAVTEDPFIVYTSNIFAILGLRSLYFLLAGVIHRIRYLKVGLAGILAFVGVKMLVSDWIKIPIPVSLGVIAAILVGAVVASLWAASRERAASSASAGDPADRSRP